MSTPELEGIGRGDPAQPPLCRSASSAPPVAGEVATAVRLARRPSPPRRSGAAAARAPGGRPSRTAAATGRRRWSAGPPRPSSASRSAVSSSAGPSGCHRLTSTEPRAEQSRSTRASRRPSPRPSSARGAGNGVGDGGAGQHERRPGTVVRGQPTQPAEDGRRPGRRTPRGSGAPRRSPRSAATAGVRASGHGRAAPNGAAGRGCSARSWRSPGPSPARLAAVSPSTAAIAPAVQPQLLTGSELVVGQRLGGREVERRVRPLAPAGPDAAPRRSPARRNRLSPPGSASGSRATYPKPSRWSTRRGDRRARRLRRRRPGGAMVPDALPAPTPRALSDRPSPASRSSARPGGRAMHVPHRRRLGPARQRSCGARAERRSVVIVASLARTRTSRTAFGGRRQDLRKPRRRKRLR